MPKPKPNEKTERNWVIYWLRRNYGWSQADLAECYGIGETRVQQILEQIALKIEKGGLFNGRTDRTI